MGENQGTIVEIRPVDPNARAAGQPETKSYKPRQSAVGRVFNGEVLAAGKEYELNETAAAAFSDLFEASERPRQATAKDEGDKGGPSEFRQTDENKQATSVRPVPTSHTPQDIGAKTLPESGPLENGSNATRTSNRAPVAQMKPEGEDGDTKGIPPIRDNNLATDRTGGPLDPAIAKGSTAAPTRPEKPAAPASSAPAPAPQKPADADKK